MQLTEALKMKNSITENGMLTNSTSLNYCLDLFFRGGAMRNSKDVEIRRLVAAAFAEDPERTLKILFWVRDVRGGAGERRFFKVAFKGLATLLPSIMESYLHLIPKYGRWDDLISLEGTSVENQVLTVISNALNDADALCAKWMPRKGSFANKLRKFRKQTPKEYRKMLVGLTNVVETAMCSKEYEKIDYSKVPSLAMARYGLAFSRNDLERFKNYVDALNNQDPTDPKVKINVDAVYPYDVIKGLRKGNETAQAQWDSLPNYMEDSKERVLPLVDTSGSMDSPVSSGGTVTCLDVALSLGIYISERNEGSFKDHFLTFSSEPELQHLTGDLRLKLNQLQTADWGMNTDLVKAFKRILDQARKHNVKPEEMPTQLLILSDMEFDESQGGCWREDVREWNETAQEMIEREYVEAGYECPKIIYWNIQSRNANVPVRFDKQGTAMVSGFSPAILTALLGGEAIDPIAIMDKVIFSERYDAIEYV